MLDTGQIMDDLIPMGRLEGDDLYRGYWMITIYPPLAGAVAVSENYT